MPKDRRSGKSIQKGNRYNEYDEIGKTNNIKVLKAKDGTKNNKMPLFSNSKNTVYFIAEEKDGVNSIVSIGIYKNRALTESIDIKDARGVHYHKWVKKIVRGKEKTVKLNEHFFNLSPKQRKIVDIANKWKNGG